MFTIISCKKRAVPIDNPDIIGLYEWSWSANNTGHHWESTKTQMNYGVQIDEDGMIFTFENGKLIEKYRFKEYFSQDNTIGIRSQETKDGQFVALFYSGELHVSNFPYPGDSNYFYRHEE